MKDRSRIVLYLFGILMFAGCSDTRQVMTSAPRSSTPAPSGDPVRMAALAISLDSGSALFSRDIEEIQFRIGEVRLLNKNNEWIEFPAESNHFEISRLNRLNRRILQTQIAPGSYDSLAVSINSVFVLFGSNAGGPVDLPDGDEVLLPVEINAVPGETTRVQLIFSPEDAFVRNDSCRWFFYPKIAQVAL